MTSKNIYSLQYGSNNFNTGKGSIQNKQIISGAQFLELIVNKERLSRHGHL